MEKRFDIEKHLRDDLELIPPSPDFSKKVMGAIAGTRIAPASRSYLNKKVVYGTALFFLLLIAAAVVYALPSLNWYTAGKFRLPVNVIKLDIGQYFNRKTVNCLLFLNVLLGLMFLDKYFIRRGRAV